MPRRQIPRAPCDPGRSAGCVIPCLPHATRPGLACARPRPRSANRRPATADRRIVARRQGGGTIPRPVVPARPTMAARGRQSTDARRSRHMRSALLRRTLPITAAALMAAFLLPSAQAGAAGPAGHPLRARITGAAIPGTSTTAAAAPAAPRGLPSKKDQIKVLEAVLAKMKTHYAKYTGFVPGPVDIFDYNIGALWRQGIDGAGTTIAVMEGWHYLAIANQVAMFDKVFGLPNPQIQTIYPAGPLPAKCPPGMVKLQSYGSCNAWKGELTLDVITAHLIAPYAKIIISATPADTEVTGDPAEHVAMPEIMKGVEFIASHHLANVMSISDGTGETTYSAGPAQITAQNA